MSDMSLRHKFEIFCKRVIEKLLPIRGVYDMLNHARKRFGFTVTMQEQIINKPIFIVGCGRSGTNLLFNLLKQHPQLVGTSGYPDGEDHVGWIKYGRCIISGLGSSPSIDGGHTGFHYCLYMDEKDVIPEIVESMTSYYYKDVIKQDTTKRVVNKCPHLSNKLKYVRAIFPDAKFVHIIRDCLPVISSWIKIMENAQPHQVLYWPETEFPCFWVFPAPSYADREVVFANEDRNFPGKGVARLVDYWSVVNQNIPIQLSSSPEQLLTVRYEDLCANSLETLNRVCDFCEISAFPEVPLEINPGYNEKYKTHLTKNQIDKFLDRARTTRSCFGYL